MEKRSLLINGTRLVDITGCVQLVKACDSKTGEVVANGNGIKVFRPNHIHGDAVIFLSYQGEDYIFGEWCKVYTHSENWSNIDYLQYEMSISSNLTPVMCDNSTMQKLHII